MPQVWKGAGGEQDLAVLMSCSGCKWMDILSNVFASQARHSFFCILASVLAVAAWAAFVINDLVSVSLREEKSHVEQGTFVCRAKV